MSADDPQLRDTALRAAAVRRLLHLQEAAELSPEHVRTVAEAFECHPRTIRRWMNNARAHDGRYTPKDRCSTWLTPVMHDALARSCGNIAAAYRELVDEDQLGENPISYATFHRTVARELDPGHRAGLRGGEPARRRYDVYAQRPRGDRNDAWEADHKQADVWVNINGERRKPWITWFVDCSTDGICGMAITPQTPSREGILVALRDALLRGPHHGPFGGLPKLVRIDGGKDFLCKTVEQALGAFSVRRVDLPPYHPELKGTVEALNSAIKKMLFPSLPGYTGRPSASMRKKRPDPDERLLTFEAFVAIVRDWIHWWNHHHKIRTMGNRTPDQAWHEDLTPIYDVDPDDLHTFTLELHNRIFTISGHGVAWGNRHYFDAWMSGRVGLKVRLRYMPHHPHQVELYDAITRRHHGSGYLQDQASEHQLQELRRTRRRAAARLRTALKKAEKNIQERYAAVTIPTTPRRLNTLTQAQADNALRELREQEIASETQPDVRRLPPPSASWNRPEPEPQPHEQAGPQADQQTPLPDRLPPPTASWKQPRTDQEQEHQ
ncbi:Mu transposase C-terminal domain-containing protein [Streptomyces sp. NPDC001820]|uniref:Mu transposase C-terminal domain-containing protein n=1 Tax=Streptomyces sp. NPDC001820 TaxID=3364613 RepID=UPI003685A2E0